MFCAAPIFWSKYKTLLLESQRNYFLILLKIELFLPMMEQKATVNPMISMSKW